MAKDDYHVIVYQILAYLYQRLKNGEPVDPKMLAYDSPIIGINCLYWAYVVCNLQDDGLIRGVIISKVDGADRYPVDLKHCQITPLGIEYLCENSLMKKVVRLLKETKSLIPFELL